MFNPDPEQAGANRVTNSDRIVGTVFLVAITTSIIAGRSAVFFMPLLTLTAVAFAAIERTPLRTFLRRESSSDLLALFLGFAILSATWSSDRKATLLYTLSIFLTFLLWHAVDRWLSVQPPRRIRHLAFWSVVAASIGLAVLLHETATEQLIRRVLVDQFGIFTPPTLGKHYWIDGSGNAQIQGFELNRSVAVLNLFLWPTVLCASSFLTGRKFLLVSLALIGGTALTTMASDHETSKIALVIGGLGLLLALYRVRAAHVAVAAAWVLAGLAVVPAAHIAHDAFALQNADWLQPSARQRIDIWNTYADKVAAAPILGAGARSAYELRADADAAEEAAATGKKENEIARHAHNAYLQAWYELGAVGVILLLAAGLAGLNQIRKLRTAVQPYALATFAVFMVEVASSWEIWQRWFAALFALTAIFLSLGIRSTETSATERGEAAPSPR